MKKCYAIDCQKQVEDHLIYCSFECAGYDGAYSIQDGWLLPVDELERRKNDVPRTVATDTPSGIKE
jgi:hypothetical protein